MTPPLGFALQEGYCASSKEALAVHYYAMMQKIPVKIFGNAKMIPYGFVPSGSVEFCEQYLGRTVTPDYYPEFLKDHLHRRVWKADNWPKQLVFVKPADKYKRFNAFITSSHLKPQPVPFWCSEVVHFIEEWRYYVADGIVLTSEWYAGDEVNMPDAPKFVTVEIPKGYCGALDFGILSTGEFALVEAQHPFACGWYGKNHDLYVEWLVRGWDYMVKMLYGKSYNQSVESQAQHM